MMCELQLGSGPQSSSVVLMAMINDECNDNNDIDEDGDDNNPAEQQYNLIDDDN